MSRARWDGVRFRSEREAMAYRTWFQGCTLADKAITGSAMSGASVSRGDSALEQLTVDGTDRNCAIFLPE